MAKAVKKPFLLAILTYLIFCGLSFLSQSVESLFGVVTMIGIAFPLAWGKWKGNLASMGFRKENLKPALGWGILGGILASLIGIAVLLELSIPDNLGLQLLIGVPLWALIVSPFQEFFFRGFMQPIFESKLGNLWGLLLSNLGFTLWHYCAPFDTSPVPLNSAVGFLATFAAGLVYAYVFQRTRNIVAPWLAHLLTGIVFVLVGAMDFVSAF
ncbi:MAG: CPBP family intramembrane metalloprotease [Anaerolineae bacterium]|jgi:membrane protease YdiL (CAAX protease family)|nr:CPBP family intramembrane metalloprotease [Anaerolineae bacterium]MBT7072899.1 CPBP family intramembrane metalloprotease [Anaerolineae bacterium]MBT7325356.1 CPBP family intramembrane metalloprotease [Anaerolineae bacterium]